MAARNSLTSALTFTRIARKYVNPAWTTNKYISFYLQRRMLSCSSALLERYYTKDHEWVDVTENIARVGITDYAQAALGEIVYVELPEEEAEVDIDDTVGAVESVKAASDVMTPVSGIVQSINEELTASPGLVNKNAEDEGWMFCIEMTAKDELDNLLDADAYKAFCEENES